jgi:UDP-4-amino-4-deoxy-L-arabinose-oxoglutarate aminotransferase
MKVEFFRHNIGEEEKKMVMECLDGIFLTTGAYTAEFEKKFCEYLGLRHSIGVMSCTAALHLALLGLDIGPGDEVITTPQTFIASSTAILHAGATPVWVDVEPDTGLIDAERIEAAITPRTKGILPVHLYGQMCDMRRIREIADKHHLVILEDAAHTIEAERDGIRPGQLGDAIAFSFYATKNITCGEGGAIGCNSDDLYEKLLLLRLHGMDKDAANRYHGGYKHWDMVSLGWKANMSNIQAAMLIPQLARIDKNWQARKDLYDTYFEALKDIPEIEIPVIKPNSKSAIHIFTVWVPAEHRDKLLTYLGEREIGVAVNYRAIHLLTYFQNTYGMPRGSFPISERIGDCTITLPFYIGMEKEKVDFVAQTIKNYFQQQ